MVSVSVISKTAKSTSASEVLNFRTDAFMTEWWDSHNATPSEMPNLAHADLTAIKTLGTDMRYVSKNTLVFITGYMRLASV